MAVRVLLTLLITTLLAASLITQVSLCLTVEDSTSHVVVRCQSDDIQMFRNSILNEAHGVDTVCMFPHNKALLIKAGKVTEILVGVNNNGHSTLKVIAMMTSLHCNNDNIVQNLTLQEFFNELPPSVQASFSHIISIKKYLPPGKFRLVGIIFYLVDRHLHETVFFNDTINVVKSDSLVSKLSVFHVTFVFSLFGLLVSSLLWFHGQMRSLSKKTKRYDESFEVGTATAEMDDESVQGSYLDRPLLNKSKKRKQLDSTSV